MRHLSALLVVFLAALTTATAQTAEDPERLLSGDISSQAWGVNERGDIVGSVTLHEGDNPVGFLYTRDGGVVTLEPPGAIWTIPLDINNRREVVGRYMDEEFRWHGFLWTSAAGFRTVDVQPGRDNVLMGIDASGTVVGYAGDTLLGTDAFVIRRGVVETLQNPFGYAVTVPTGISENGTIGGYLTEPSPSRGFILRNGEWRTIDSPTGGDLAFYDISPAGTIVGEAAGLELFSFAFRGGEFTEIGRFHLSVRGVNGSELFVGSMNEPDGHFHAVRWRRTGP
jgi:uncharacterized membrane protein